MNYDDEVLDLADFHTAVRESVMRRLGDEAGDVRVSDDGAEYAREALRVHVDAQRGGVLMTYVKTPTESRGHSSGAGIPQRPTRRNVETIANEVAARLADPFHYR